MPCFFKKISWQSLLHGKMNFNLRKSQAKDDQEEGFIKTQNDGQNFLWQKQTIFDEHRLSVTHIPQLFQAGATVLPLFDKF